MSGWLKCKACETRSFGLVIQAFLSISVARKKEKGVSGKTSRLIQIRFLKHEDIGQGLPNLHLNEKYHPTLPLIWCLVLQHIVQLPCSFTSNFVCAESRSFACFFVEIVPLRKATAGETDDVIDYRWLLFCLPFKMKQNFSMNVSSMRSIENFNLAIQIFLVF